MSLPSGYKRLEYIKSSGTQYIDTGFKPKNTTRVICDFQFENTAKTQHLFCERGPYNGYANRYGLLLISAGYFRSDYGSANKNFPTTVALGGRHTVDKNGLSCTIDDTTVTNTAKTFTGSYNLYLFAGNTGGSMSNPASVKVYSCQIYDNGTLIRDFIPCQTAGGEIGLWDDVNSVFYGNYGTGTFTAGPVIAISVALSDITQLEYIQSSGTQYIDTGIIETNDTAINCKFNIDTAARDYLFGSQQNLSSMAYNGFYYNNALEYNYQEIAISASDNIEIQQKVEDSTNTIVINGTSYSAEIGTCQNSSLLIFAIRYRPDYQNGSVRINSGSAKVYYFQIVQGGNLVFDGIPCISASGEVGLYDLIGKMFYINVGTGTFIGGGYVLNLPVNIGGDWKKANEAFVNIGGTWKIVKDAFVNIGGAWKKIG